MAKKPYGNNISEDWLKSKGYSLNPDGSWQPPKFRNPFKEEPRNPDVIQRKTYLITKEKVNNSPDFEVTPKLEWFIPYQIPSKKNSQQLYIKKVGAKMIPAVTTSQRYKDYVTATKMYWEVFGKEFRNSVERLKICPPYQIEFTFIRSTRQKVDYVGPLESCQDIMQDFGWLENDDAYTMKPHLGDLEVDKENPGVRIKIIK